MALSRRALLAAPLLAAATRPARAATLAMLRPGIATPLSFAPLPQERLAFHVAGLDAAITLPAARARLAALLPIARRQVAVLAFGADPANGAGRLDLAAIVGWDGGCLRVLALEVLIWQAPGGGRLGTRMRATGDSRARAPMPPKWLGTRMRATGDRTRLLLLRDAGKPRGLRPWQNESWIDLLAWRDHAALADAPVRTPVAGTWQARLATVRARVAARLAAPCQDVDEDLVALIAPADLPPG